MPTLAEQIRRSEEQTRIAGDRKYRADKHPDGFASENNTTVSTVEWFDASNITLTRFYNFAAQKITTQMCSEDKYVQQFNEISDQSRIEKAAKALKEFGGDTCAWKARKPKTLPRQP
jgi:hypothetical protein